MTFVPDHFTIWFVLDITFFRLLELVREGDDGGSEEASGRSSGKRSLQCELLMMSVGLVRSVSRFLIGETSCRCCVGFSASFDIKAAVKANKEFQFRNISDALGLSYNEVKHYMAEFLKNGGSTDGQLRTQTTGKLLSPSIR